MASQRLRTGGIERCRKSRVNRRWLVNKPIAGIGVEKPRQTALAMVLSGTVIR